MCQDYLMHYRTPGSKNGVRLYQYPDGTWTELGKERRRIGSNTPGVYKKSDVVFISGKVSYDRRIPKRVQNELDACMKADAKIIVGDAPGADTRVQDYLAEKKYKNVEVYTTDAKVRNNVGNWKVNKISSDGYSDEREVRRQKDIAMTNAATRGFAISSDDDRPESATSLNIQRMKEQGKQIDLYDFKKGQYYVDEERSELKHYGIPGMKKGRRRWQTKDGSRTPAGHRRYDTRMVRYIDKLMAQGYPQKQAVAIAYRLVARDEGRGDTGSIKLKNKFNEDGKRLSLQSFLEQQVADEGLEGRRAAAQVRYRQRILKEKGADFIKEYIESGGENYEW